MDIQKMGILLFISMLMMGVFTGVSSGEDINFNITPDNPVKGDIITVYGHANPNGLIKAAVTFEGDLHLENGEYTISVRGLDIPFENIKFTAFVYGCKTLELSGRKPLWGELCTPWVTLSTDAVDGVATLSYSIPPGTYDVSAHITSDKNSVLKVKIIASGLIKTDANGNFNYSYDTSLGIPGNVRISIGGESKIITLSEPEKEVAPPSGHHKNHHHSSPTNSNQQQSIEIDDISRNNIGNETAQDITSEEKQVEATQIDETQDAMVKGEQVDAPQKIISEKEQDNREIRGPISIGDLFGDLAKEISKAIDSFFHTLKSLF